MQGEERSLRRLENVQRRARPRIDLHQPKDFTIDKKIRAVQSNERHRSSEPMDGAGERICGARRECRRPYRTTVAVRLARRGQRPLRAKSEHRGALSVGEKKRRYR